MKQPTTKNQGVTIIELLLVVSIIALLGATTSPFLSNFITRNNQETTTNKLVSIITKAQSYALAGKNNATWGVCLSDSKLRLFSTSCTSPTFSEDFTLSSTITVSGLTETTFSNLRGEPSSALSITVVSSLDSDTVTLNAAGGLNVN